MPCSAAAGTDALLKPLRDTKVPAAIRERFGAGMPYIGSSAGSNLVGPWILVRHPGPALLSATAALAWWGVL